MKRRLDDYRVFLREFRRNFRTTGAVLPSGRALGRALARHVRESAGAKRILEVGPGTGSVTVQIVCDMGDQDRLDLVELNDEFVSRLEQRFAQEALFQGVAGRTRVLHQSIADMPPGEPYDLVISGLPLNNFSVAEVQQLLDGLVNHVRPGGILSFFEYIAVRNAKALLSGPSDRQRLRGIGQTLNRMFQEHTTRRQWVWPNVPPAWVHHVTIRKTPE